MANGKESFVRMTRAATKRKALMDPTLIEVKKMRVVLGELPNLSNVIFPNRTKNPRKVVKVSTKKKKPVSIVVTPIEPKSKIDTRSDDLQMCSPYVADISEYLRQLECKEKSRPMVGYIEKNLKGVTPKMREMLMDWLVEVAEEYKLLSETLYLTVSYIDRFLSVITVERKRLQLVGVSAMLIASKYEEITPPNVEDFVHITDNTFTKQEVLEMESDILLALRYEIGGPTSITFLRFESNAKMLDI